MNQNEIQYKFQILTEGKVLMSNYLTMYSIRNKDDELTVVFGELL